VPDPAAPTREQPTLADPTVLAGTSSTTGRVRPRWRQTWWWLVLVAGLAGMALAEVGWRAVSGPHEQPGAWGGHENGRIPAAELCPLAGAASHRLRCDAADAYGKMAAAYRAHFGTRLCITDSYRAYEAQVAAQRKKPALAADPGTSNHGWALAVDLCGGANDFGTPQHTWLKANAPRFGWRQPPWATRAGANPEPWHWEFGRL